ncbi:MAG: CsgG/HfaB family protein [Bacteroidota bacterium]
MGKRLLKNWFALFGTLLLWSSCGTLLQQPVQSEPARIGESTQTAIDLKNLPPPKEKIVAAVYQFRDQTGQYKTGGGFSTAVTQGATNILIKALKDSGWFIPIERENVNNLLNERKIVRNTRAQFNAKGGLKPLLYASVLLEGGIISYDQNVITGGAGLRYFGAGGSEQYRQDRVTVYLRAISVQTGEVLKVIYTSKTILSQSVDVGLFRFVSFGKLLETETGLTYNEPTQIAVSEAINKAVQGMVIEGIEDKMWNLGERRFEADEQIKAYKKENEEAPQIDFLGKKQDNRRKKYAANFSTASLLYAGDFPNARTRTGVEFGFNYELNPTIGFQANYGIGSMEAERFYFSNVSYLEANLNYRALPYDVFTPYIFGGLGLITENDKHPFDFAVHTFSKANVGVGVELLLNDRFSVRASLDYNVILSDNLDRIEQGRYNDFYWRGNVGVKYYFGTPLKGKRKFKVNSEYDK